MIVVCNLKEAKLGGVSSNGMVLCASSEDKSEVKFVDPPADRQVDSAVLETPQLATLTSQGSWLLGALATRDERPSHTEAQ